MLNQTLTKKSYNAFVQLKTINSEIHTGILETLELELQDCQSKLDEESQTIEIYRLQGQIKQLKELIQITKEPKTFRGLFNE